MALVAHADWCWDRPAVHSTWQQGICKAEQQTSGERWAGRWFSPLSLSSYSDQQHLSCNNLHFLIFGLFIWWESGGKLVSLLLTARSVLIYPVQLLSFWRCSNGHPLRQLICSSACLRGCFSLPSFTPTLPLSLGWGPERLFPYSVEVILSRVVLATEGG